MPLGLQTSKGHRSSLVASQSVCHRGCKKTWAQERMCQASGRTKVQPSITSGKPSNQLDFPSICLQMMLGGLIFHGIHLLVQVRCLLITPQINAILEMKNWGSKPYSGSGDYVGPKTQQSLAPNQFGVISSNSLCGSL